MTPALHDKASQLVALCKARKLTITTAESCTGGLVAAAITSVSGSSEVFERGFVTYSDEAKTEMIGVNAALIAKHGAVSEETARAMAEGAQRAAKADIAVAVTGIAGPTGGSPSKPVGLVFIATARSAMLCREFRFGNPGREAVRVQSALEALKMLLDQAAAGGGP
ncbi:MAG: CinA family protein [Rhizobiales bacterium]|nr:CinA family protein [Hyphomicrobiales bacterium]